MPLNPIPHSKPRKWSVTKIRNLVQAKFNKQACWFQIKVATVALYAGKDVVACTATGAGKTLSFWIPLLMAIEDQPSLPLLIGKMGLSGMIFGVHCSCIYY